MEKIDVLGHLMLPTIVTGIMIFTTHKSSENWKGERKVVSIKCKIGLQVTIFTHIKVICPQRQQLLSSSIVYQQIQFRR